MSRNSSISMCLYPDVRSLPKSEYLEDLPWLRRVETGNPLSYPWLLGEQASINTKPQSEPCH